MEHLTRSRTAMALALAGAGLYVLGDVLSVVAYAILSPGHLGAFRNLGHGSDWLRFCAALVVLAGVAAAAWELVLENRVAGAVELGVATVGTLLVAVGALINAASPNQQTATDVVGATGIGVWAFLVLSRAARQSLSEQHHDGGRPLQAPLWFGAALGLLVFAVGAGLPLNVNEQGQSVASGVLMAVGMGILAGALVVARSDRVLLGRPVPLVLVGLALLVASFLADAIVAGIVFGSGFTLTGLRVGVALATTIELCGVAVLGVAAWLRLAELLPAAAPASGPLAPPPGPFAPPPSPFAPSPGPFAPPPGPLAPPPTVTQPSTPSTGWPAVSSASPPGPSAESGGAEDGPLATEELRPCPSCGTPTGPGARFCAQCGRPLLGP